MAKSSLKNRSGVTLIELLVVMAVMVLVISTIFSLFFFGNNSFTFSRSQYDLQSQVRFTMDTIINEVRFATSLEIIDVDTASDPDEYEAGFSYFYIADEKLHHIFYYDDLGDHHNKIVGEFLDSDASSFSQVNSTTLSINISCVYQNQSYSGQTEITLPNLKINGNSIIGSGDLGLKYRRNTN